MAQRCKCCMKQIESDVCPHCGYPAQIHNEAHQLEISIDAAAELYRNVSGNMALTIED